jgi:hypothetical protein
VIENTLEEVDSTIRVDTPHGPAFYRYNGDGYGERERGEEGAPWSVEAKGKGRLWPIFTGERAEYELLNEDREDPDLDPQNMLRTMQRFANSGRMISEQVWDREVPTAYNWSFGEGTGAATPLAWSMAQYVRLAHSIDVGRPVEMPDFIRERYLETDRPEGPSLRVDTHFEGDHLVISGTTDGDIVSVKTPSETELVDAEDGEFTAKLGIEYGENQVTVAAATSEDLTSAGTTVTRFTL